ncbi:hypothetical protein BD779DRAFT_77985 [Infundibulicybe gibba]|nr:hypothetical protein BD779DRAFT_77985 [Infundibulicybe gibba]
MHAATSTKTQEARVAALQAEIDGLQAMLGKDADAERIVKRHIKLLHEYNETKDATQASIQMCANPDACVFISIQILIGRVSASCAWNERWLNQDSLLH